MENGYLKKDDIFIMRCNIDTLLKKHGVTHQELADALGFQLHTVRGLMSKNGRPFTSEEIVIMSRLFIVPVQSFFNGVA